MTLTLDECTRLICAAHEEAAKLGLRVTVAVVDEGGHLQALARMDGAFPLSPQIAEAKAIGTVLWHRDGDSLNQVKQDRPAFFERVDRLVRLPLMPALGSGWARAASA